MNDRKFFINVNRAQVEVTKEVYLAYYRSKRRDRYFERDLKTETPIRDKSGNITSYAPAKEDSLERRMDAGEQFAAVQKSVEDTVIDRLMAEDLHKAMDKLPASDRALINALYFRGLTERQTAVVFGLSQKAINKRKVKILMLLKRILEN